MGDLIELLATQNAGKITDVIIWNTEASYCVTRITVDSTYCRFATWPSSSTLWSS